MKSIKDMKSMLDRLKNEKASKHILLKEKFEPTLHHAEKDEDKEGEEIESLINSQEKTEMSGIQSP